MKKFIWGIALGLSIALTALATQCNAATFYYTGPFGGDFFNEANWNSLPGGGGASPAAGTIEPTTGVGGFSHDLIIDGKNVMATVPSGLRLDVGLGSLTLLAGSELQVTNDFFNAQFELSSSGTLTLVDSILGVDDDIFLFGTSSFSGGTVESFADDIEFVSSALTISGTHFVSDDSILFRAEITPAAGSSVIGATFQSASRIHIREFDVTMTDSVIDVTGDVENTFTTDLDDATGTLTLLGDSSLTADQIQEGVKLRLGGSSTATLLNVDDGDDELSWFTQSSTATIDSPDAQLVLFSPQSVSAATKVINGVTGLAYADDPSTWNVTNWNGMSAVTLSITSVPSESNADFDGDGDVDGRDFLIWQRGFGLTGQTNNSLGDANGDGEIDALDLIEWQSQYGGAPLGAVTAVPEPASLALMALVIFSSCMIRRR